MTNDHVRTVFPFHKRSFPIGLFSLSGAADRQQGEPPFCPDSPPSSGRPPSVVDSRYRQSNAFAAQEVMVSAPMTVVMMVQMALMMTRQWSFEILPIMESVLKKVRQSVFF